jgi:hypothetical protein
MFDVKCSHVIDTCYRGKYIRERNSQLQHGEGQRGCQLSYGFGEKSSWKVTLEQSFLKTVREQVTKTPAGRASTREEQQQVQRL